MHNRGVRAVVPAFVIMMAIAACGDLASDSHGKSAGSAPKSVETTAIPSTSPALVTPAPSAPAISGPVSLGADPSIGTLSGGPIQGWTYEGRTGALSPQAAGTPSTGVRSPSGRLVTDQRNVMSGGFIERTDLWLVDTVSGGERLLYSPPPIASSSAKPIQPNLNLPPYVFQRTEWVGSWSPDERYLTMWRIDLVSASMDADGRPFVVIDVTSGAITDLGYTLYAYAWRAPHTIAYVAGSGRETWNRKTLRVWTPESGSRDITGPEEVGLVPAWGTDGRLWFVRGPAGEYDRATYFAGRGIGDRSIVIVDLVTGVRTTLPRLAGYADEGVRVAEDGRTVLILRRRLDPTLKAIADSWLELWAARSDGSSAHPLLRLGGNGGFGYYGTYPSLAKLVWTH